MCRAQNEIGLQEHPCIFHLMPAGKPDPVSNCSVSNQSYSTMSVTCKYGFNGGLRQVNRPHQLLLVSLIKFTFNKYQIFHLLSNSYTISISRSLIC